jgi:pyrroline-5-carboxylate reductase
MAAAMARGFRLRGGPEAMLFSDAGSGRAAALASELNGAATASLAELAGSSDVIVLAVKPTALDQAAQALGPFPGPLVSVLGATPAARVQSAFPAASVLRTMPNLAVEVGRGVICHAPPADPGALVPVLELLGRIATLIELPEEQLDAATALMGCTPAYLALACEALSDAGVSAGLDPELAGRLIGLTAAGAGELLVTHDPADLQRAVASPGGSTEAGLEALGEHRVREAFAAAVSASLERMEGKR